MNSDKDSTYLTCSLKALTPRTDEGEMAYNALAIVKGLIGQRGIILPDDFGCSDPKFDERMKNNISDYRNKVISRAFLNPIELAEEFSEKSGVMTVYGNFGCIDDPLFKRNVKRSEAEGSEGFIAFKKACESMNEKPVIGSVRNFKGAYEIHVTSEREKNRLVEQLLSVG